MRVRLPPGAPFYKWRFKVDFLVLKVLSYFLIYILSFIFVFFFIRKYTTHNSFLFDICKTALVIASFLGIFTFFLYSCIKIENLQIFNSVLEYSVLFLELSVIIFVCSGILTFFKIMWDCEMI